MFKERSLQATIQIDSARRGGAAWALLAGIPQLSELRTASQMYSDCFGVK